MANEPKLRPLGWIAVMIFVAACIWGAYHFLPKSALHRLAGGTGSSGSPSIFGGKPQVEIGVAYGTEKQRWLEWAVAEFANRPEGKNIKVNLIPMGSLEGAHAILDGDQRIDAWSPASSAYKDVFVQDWQAKYPDNPNPILREEPLALTPMVFVMWEERYQAFLPKYKQVSFDTISQALQEKTGWQGIAGHAEWGLFKFGHTLPSDSNSGLMTLVLAAYAYHHKTRELTLKDILDAGFQDWLQKMERGVTGMSNSTGNMMREMVLKGPSSYDALFVYESVTIDYLKNAEGRWGAIRVIYPEYNAWNDNPYYILNAPWSSAEQRTAAASFLDFLLSEPIQKQSLVHGFRPGNPNVAVRFPGSPFEAYSKFGIQVDLEKICDPPKAEVVNNLLESWQRNQGGR
jgi:ABC-type Fe3+ transport system substrate-binding protein